MTITFKGLIAPTDVPTGDGRIFAAGKMTHRPMPVPVMAQFGSGGHNGAVPVAKVMNVCPGPGGYWGEGYFLDPMFAPEVPRAVYMLQEKVLGPSVDLDRDYTVKAIPHPSRPDKKAALFEEYNVIGVTLVPMPAFYQVHMSVDTAEEKALLASAGVNVDLFLDPEEFLQMASSEMVYAPSFEELDKAECGCNTKDHSMGIVPMKQGNSMEPVTNLNLTQNGGVTVGASMLPSSVTFTFGSNTGTPGFNMYEGYEGTGGGSSPIAVVKVMEDETVVKVPKPESDEAHYFDEDGLCPTCGY